MPAVLFPAIIKAGCVPFFKIFCFCKFSTYLQFVKRMMVCGQAPLRLVLALACPKGGGGLPFFVVADVFCRHEGVNHRCRDKGGLDCVHAARERRKSIEATAKKKTARLHGPLCIDDKRTSQLKEKAGFSAWPSIAARELHPHFFLPYQWGRHWPDKQWHGCPNLQMASLDC